MERAEEHARRDFVQERREHWDRLGQAGLQRRAASRQYHRRLTAIYRFLIPEGKRVLEMGCGQGDLLAALKPEHGVGVDLAESMVAAGRLRHPQLEFRCGDALDVEIEGSFDFIVMSDLIDDVWDVQELFRRVRAWCLPHTRIIINSYSRLWQIPMAMAAAMGLATPLKPQNWITPEDVAHMLALEGFEILGKHREILCPLPIPLLAGLCDRVLVRMPLISRAALTNVYIARAADLSPFTGAPPTVSVIVPARNEKGNITAIFERTPDMGGGTELVFVEGGSTDGTFEEIEKQIRLHPGRNCQLLRQPGKGKGDAVRVGFNAAAGSIFMILDADLTVPPEALPQFYAAIFTNRGEFINGVRLVYPMEKRAMRFMNLLGNKFFSFAFSWLLGQPIRDTLCGTKVLSRSHYAMIAANRHYFGDFDPFGDFDLLFGAAKLNLKIVGLPIRYRERTYGTTNIQRYRHGLILLRMVLFASARLKFQ